MSVFHCCGCEESGELEREGCQDVESVVSMFMEGEHEMEAGAEFGADMTIRLYFFKIINKYN